MTNTIALETVKTTVEVWGVCPQGPTLNWYYRIVPTPNRAARRLCREHAGAHRTCPVVLVPGRRAPHIVGESYYHTTPSGKTRVYHPNAYKWPTVYHHSTLRVEVGRDWLLRRCTH